MYHVPVDQPWYRRGLMVSIRLYIHTHELPPRYKSLINLRCFPYCLAILRGNGYELQETQRPDKMERKGQACGVYSQRTCLFLRFRVLILFLGSHNLITQWLPSSPSR
jgi:hypothetical protein